MELPEYDHPAWITGIGTIFGYGIILAILTLAIYIIPSLIFMAV